VSILVKIDFKKCDRERARRLTDRLADTLTRRQMQTEFIICPMHYAIAMGQIINANDHVDTKLYYGSKSSPFYFCDYSVKCSPILIIFSNIAAEKISNLMTYFYY